MQKLLLEWLNLKNGHKGKRPEMVPDGDAYQRILSLESKDFIATMPLQLAAIGLLGETIEASFGTNLYKNKLTMAEPSKKWTKKIMESMGVNFQKAYSVALFDATKRVMIVDEKGYHYATKGHSINTTRTNSETSERSIRSPDFWKDDEYDFWERDAQPQADAIMTNLPNQTLCVYSADCVLGLISDPEHRAVGIFHAMWRNLVNQGTNNFFSTSFSIIDELVKEMQLFYKSEPSLLEVQIFPCASKETYIVGLNTALSFTPYGLEEAVTPSEEAGKFHIDLAKATSLILEKCGVSKNNIHFTPYTTDDIELSSLRNGAKGRGYRNQIMYNPARVYLPDKEIPARTTPLANENFQNVLIVQTI